MPHSTETPRTWQSMIFDHEIDEARPMKVICVGAGISGILSAIRLPSQIENLELVVYDKNPEVGGTWYENRYPGVRCDIPSAGYQLTFESNTQWSEFYASGAEIQEYMVNLAKRYDVYKYCKLSHSVDGAIWNEQTGQWQVQVTDLNTGEKKSDFCNVLLMGTGLLNAWQWPKIPGFENFKGQKVHTANWDTSINVEGREVALIGAGSTGIQILPAIQPLVKRIDHYMKSSNWISPLGIGGDELLRREELTGNFAHSIEELDQFRSPEEYAKFRHRIEGDIMQAPLAAFQGTSQQKEFHVTSEKHMQDKLKSRPLILKSLMPDWAPGCRRLTPGPGYLEACCQENVDYISTPIKCIHEDGIETVDGKFRKVDLIICATGFDVSRGKGPAIIGSEGRDLYKDVWNPIPEAYLSMCPPSMPNMFIYFGPNGGPMTGSTILMLEWVCDYVISCVQKLQREFYKSMVVKSESPFPLCQAGCRTSNTFADVVIDLYRSEVNKDWVRHTEQFFAKTVFSLPCTSWFKRGTKDGRITANWPGSGVHSRKALLNPRWEDFDFQKMPETEENVLAWLGNGITVAQRDGKFTTEYLDLKQTVNKPTPVHPEISVASKRR